MTGPSSEFATLGEIRAVVSDSSDISAIIEYIGRPDESISELLMSYEDLFLEFLSKIRAEGRLSDLDYANLRGLHNAIQNDLEGITKREVSVRSSLVIEDLHALSFMGGLTYDNVNRTVSMFISPQMLLNCITLCGEMDSRSRVRHITEISRIRGETLTEAKAMDADREFVAPFVGRLSSTIKDMLNQKNPVYFPHSRLAGITVEYLASSSDFYLAGIDYYRDRAARRHDHYVFSTTSGILLPEENLGADFFRDVLPIPEMYERTRKNPWRRRYFQTLGRVFSKPRWYCYELERSGRAFQRTLADIEAIAGAEAAQQYEMHSKEILARFLGTPGFGVREIEKFSELMNYFTLANGRGLIVSARDKRDAPIAEGFWLRPGRVNGKRGSVDLRSAGIALLTAEVKAIIEGHPSKPELSAFLAALAVGYLVPVYRLIRQKLSQAQARTIIQELDERLRTDAIVSTTHVIKDQYPSRHIDIDRLSSEIILRLKTVRLTE